MITSSTNNKVKYVKRLQEERRFRQREGVYIIEGTRWLNELVQLEREPLDIFYTTAWLEKLENRVILDQLPGRKHQVTPTIMQTISDLATPAGILATLPITPQPLPTHPSHLLLLDRIRIPGNLGTLFRTAAAAGLDGILLAPGCVDPHNPKVVRGGMGAHLRLPIHTCTWEQIASLTAPTTVWLATANGQTPYTAVNWQQPTTLLIGGEANGASPESERLNPGRIAIPLANQTESLNAAIATAIILFEAVRQRSQ